MINLSKYVKIVIVVNVNGFKSGDVLLVDPKDEVFAGIIKQNLAKVIDNGM